MARIFYADGSCSGNGKPTACGGWCFAEITIDANGIETLYNLKSKGEAPGEVKIVPTSIRMELKAVINALGSVEYPEKITIYSDSAYVINGINNRWYKNWDMDGTRRYGKRPANPDLWKQLIELIDYHGAENITGIHIPGHKGFRWQELCDGIAQQKTQEAKLRRG